MKGENMKNILKTLALVAVIATNVSIFASNASAYVTVDGYFKSNDTYVAPHIRTNPDGVCWNNFSGC